MLKMNDIPEDDRPVLYPDKNHDTLYRVYYRPLNAAIIKGVMIHISAWPSHLFATFITGCFIFAAFIIIAVVGVIFQTPNANNEFYRISREMEIEECPNVYFMKHASKTWSQEQLCGIESSAREYPGIKVYLINLLTRDAALDISRSLNASIPLGDVNSEEDMRKALGVTYQNVRNIDIAAHAFFKKSMLANMYDTFDTQTLEAAAKAQLLWTCPGVALDPTVAYQLKELQQFICRPSTSCQLPRHAAINVEGSVQASGFPCNAFLGYFINKLATRKFIIKRETFKDVYQSFCTRQIKCAGIKILANKSRAITTGISCPIISEAMSAQRSTQ